jgi:hypothetical protein
MLIGLLVAPLTGKALTLSGLSDSKDKILTVHVNLIPINIVEGNSQSLIGTFNPPSNGNPIIHTYTPEDNYAEFVVSGARGYWFHYSYDYHYTNPLNHTCDLSKTGDLTKGVHASHFSLMGADESTHGGGNGFYTIPEDGTGPLGNGYTGSGNDQSAKLGVNPTSAKFWIRVTISKLQIDVGAAHGDYFFPITITVNYLSGF